VYVEREREREREGRGGGERESLCDTPFSLYVYTFVCVCVQCTRSDLISVYQMIAFEFAESELLKPVDEFKVYEASSVLISVNPKP